MLKLADNKNGDICVSDFAGKNVVVVDVCGDLRFKNKGNITKCTHYKTFKPSISLQMISNKYLLQISQMTLSTSSTVMVTLSVTLSFRVRVDFVSIITTILSLEKKRLE